LFFSRVRATLRKMQARREQERSRITRERLIEAGVACVAELGWAQTTMSVIARRAGVSRGASQHHFRTRDELVAAAVAHFGRRRLDEIRRRAARLPAGNARTEEIVAMLAGFYGGTFFAAASQLWVAAISDARLRAQVTTLERGVNREVLHLTLDLFGASAHSAEAREAILATLDFVRGLGLAGLLRDDVARRRQRLAWWARVLDERLALAHGRARSRAAEPRLGRT
jgi:AcrR family transcriptional regulator